MRTSQIAVTAAMCGMASILACSGAIPAAVQFVDTIPEQPRIGDITTVRFRAIDSTGNPMPGAELQFSIPDAGASGGIIINPTVGYTNKGDGIATTQLVAAGRVASVVVMAKAGPLTAISPPITFSGANSPNGRQFTFQCGSVAGLASGGIHAIGAYDATRYLIAGVKVNCFAHVADRNGDGIPNALVSFITEAGTIGASGISMSDAVGNAEVMHKTSLPLPKEVTPGTFTFTPTLDDTHMGTLLAPMWMHPFEWSRNPIKDLLTLVPANLDEPRRNDPIRPGMQNNPRDNLVSMIAVTSGEEGYIDTDNNGTWNTGEPFDDLPEPFVDANDNGTYDSDERWIDSNGNGVWDKKNGVWDASTLIWAPERIIWTGMPALQDRIDPAAQCFGQITGGGSPIGHWLNQDYEFALSDPWFNTIAQNGETDGCEVPNIDGKKLINLNPSTFARGKRFTYPAFVTLKTNITDAHDPFKDPKDPQYASPIGFAVPADCLFTASQVNGHQVVIPLVLNGTVL